MQQAPMKLHIQTLLTKIFKSEIKFCDSDGYSFDLQWVPLNERRKPLVKIWVKLCEKFLLQSVLDPIRDVVRDESVLTRRPTKREPII